MSKKFLWALSLTLPFLAGGCLSQSSSPVIAPVYTHTKSAVLSTDEVSGSKKGSATCQSFMIFAAWGDCSLDAAKRDGGITKVSHVDAESKTVLGVVNSYTLTVYGE